MQRGMSCHRQIRRRDIEQGCEGELDSDVNVCGSCEERDRQNVHLVFMARPERLGVCPRTEGGECSGSEPGAESHSGCQDAASCDTSTTD